MINSKALRFTALYANQSFIFWKSTNFMSKTISEEIHHITSKKTIYISKNKYNHIIPMTDNESNRNWKFVGTLQILHRWWDHLSWDKTLLNLKYKWINMYYKFISCPETTYCDEITYQVPRIESSANLTNRLQLLWQLHIFRTCIWI